jgi:hypothetical protein
MTVSFFREGVLLGLRRAHEDPIPRFVMNGRGIARHRTGATSW